MQKTHRAPSLENRSTVRELVPKQLPHAQCAHTFLPFHETRPIAHLYPPVNGPSIYAVKQSLRISDRSESPRLRFGASVVFQVVSSITTERYTRITDHR